MTINAATGEFYFGKELMVGLDGTVVTGITAIMQKALEGFTVSLGIGLKVSRFVPHFTLKALLDPVVTPVGAAVVPKPVPTSKT